MSGGMREMLKGAEHALDDLGKTPAAAPAARRATTAPGQMLERQVMGVAQENDQLRAQLDALMRELELSLIDPNPHQPRLEFDQETIDELAASISEIGLREPIIVRPGVAPGRYILVAGERRIRAVKQLGRDRIPAKIDIDFTEESAAIFSTVENLQRKDLSHYEQFKAFTHMLQAGWAKSNNDLAKKLGVSRTAVSYMLEYGRLPADVLLALDARPSLFGYNTAHALGLLCNTKEGARLVTEAVTRLANGEIASEAATLDWIRKRQRSPAARSVTQIANGRGQTVFHMSKAERQVTVSLEKGVDAAVLVGIEEALAAVLKKQADKLT